MRYLKSFKQKWDFRQKSKEIRKICDRYNIVNYTINSDLSIDVNGSVYINNRSFLSTIFKIPIKFNNVSGDFDCSNTGLQSLENCPKSVGGFFSSDYNNLDSLVGSPEYVGDSFNFRGNNIKSFKGSPERCGDIDCSFNDITSFEGFPKSSWIICRGNPIEVFVDLVGTFDYYKIELFNDYDIIQGDEVIFDRFNDYLKAIGRLKGDFHPGIPKTAPVVKQIEKFYKIIY